MDKKINDKRYEQLPWTEKYRPTKMEDIYLPPLITEKMNGIIKDKNMPNIILSGPSGIGKSSIIKIIAMSLYGKYYKDAVLELGLLDDRGIKFMQNDIVLYCKTKISYRAEDEDLYPKYKLIIFDEGDNIISRVQDQICIIMEKYSAYIRFAFTCNSSSSINEGIQTKSIILMYPFLTSEMIVGRMKKICKMEKVKFDELALEKICNISQGDLRSAINKLELICNKYECVKSEHVDELCVAPQEMIIKKLFDHTINNDMKNAFKIVLDLRQKSYSGSDITLGMLTTMSSNICANIEEEKKIKMCDQICRGIYNISNIKDSNIQLTANIIDIIDSINNN